MDDVQPQVWRMALGQVNATIGDLAGNVALLRENILRARAAGARIIALPELALTGYPPEDLLLRTSFLSAARAALEDLLDVA
ncbi:MAG: NAD+ synthase, partial [Chloroflexi bacterium]